MPPLTTIVATDLPERITAAARNVRDAAMAHQLAIEQRDELILEAVDTGALSQRQVAKLAGFSGVAGVCRVLAKPRD